VSPQVIFSGSAAGGGGAMGVVVGEIHMTHTLSLVTSTSRVPVGAALKERREKGANGGAKEGTKRASPKA
jgi:hypothetical protein